MDYFELRKRAACLAYLQSLLPPEQEYLYEIISQEAVLQRYIGRKVNVNVPATIGGSPVKKIEVTCFGFSNLRKAVIPSGITTIG